MPVTYHNYTIYNISISRSEILLSKQLPGAYVEDMYEAWAHDPKSVHPSWDSYFR